MSGKLAILYVNTASYTRACVEALVDMYHWQVMAIHYPRSAEAPFSDEPLQNCADCFAREDFKSGGEIAAKVREFGADVVLIPGWMDNGYLAAARELKKEGVLVVAGSDTQYSGSLRQRVASLIAPWYLHRSINILWVTGERQRQFAWSLGYRGRQCWTGMYCCDHEKFARAGRGSATRGKHFLYVGRYIERKGLDVLLAAYAEYRKNVDDPWELHCAGAGELSAAFAGCDGVKDLGFVQPDVLPEVMAGAACFVLPSRVEPWGVVVQEAAAAGCPVLCSDAAGAAPHLVRDGFNGYTFANGSVEELADLLERVHNMATEDRRKMGQAGRGLAAGYTPEIWAKTLVEGSGL